MRIIAEIVSQIDQIALQGDKNGKRGKKYQIGTISWDSTREAKFSMKNRRTRESNG